MKSRPFACPDDLGPCLDEAAAVVAAGGVLLLPTESFYGLGADPRSESAVERVLTLKARPGDLGLPVVCCDWQQIDGFVVRALALI